MSTLGANETRKRWWTAIAGSVGSCLVGLAFARGLIRKQPTPVPAQLADEAPATSRT